MERGRGWKTVFIFYFFAAVVLLPCKQLAQPIPKLVVAAAAAFHQRNKKVVMRKNLSRSVVRAAGCRY